MRGGAPSDGAQVGLGVELRDDDLEGDLGSLILQRGVGHDDHRFTVGWYHTWEETERTKGMVGSWNCDLFIQNK